MASTTTSINLTGVTGNVYAAAGYTTIYTNVPQANAINFLVGASASVNITNPLYATDTATGYHVLETIQVQGVSTSYTVYSYYGLVTLTGYGSNAGQIISFQLTKPSGGANNSGVNVQFLDGTLAFTSNISPTGVWTTWVTQGGTGTTTWGTGSVALPWTAATAEGLNDFTTNTLNTAVNSSGVTNWTGGSASNYVLTTGIDTIPSSGVMPAGATVTGTLTGTATTSTLNTGDTVTGAGDTTFKLFSSTAAAAIPSGTTLTGIGTLVFNSSVQDIATYTAGTAFGAAGNGQLKYGATAIATNLAIDASQIGGLKTVIASAITANNNDIINIAPTVTLQVTGATTTIVGFHINSSAAAADTYTLNLNGATFLASAGAATAALASGILVDGLGTTLALTGTGAVTTTASSAPTSTVAIGDFTATTLNINTTGATSIALYDTATLKVVNASGSTGTLNVDLTNTTFGTASLTVTAGAGNDRFSFASGIIGGGTFATAFAITGNASYSDTLAIADVAVGVAGNLTTNLNKVTNFKVLELTAAPAIAVGATTPGIALTASGITSVSSFLFSGAVTSAGANTAGVGQAAISVTGESNTQNYTVTQSEIGQQGKAAASAVNAGGDAIYIVPNLNTGSNILNLTIGSSTTSASLTETGGAAGTGSGANGGHALDLQQFQTVNLTTTSTGTSGLTDTFTGGALDGGGTNGFGLAVATGTTINLSGNTATTFTTIGGTPVSGLVNITLNAASDTAKVQANFALAGNDSFTSGSGGTTTTGIVFAAGGVDSANLSASTAVADHITFGSPTNTTATLIDSITGFTNASTTGDQVTLTNAAGNGANALAAAVTSQAYTISTGATTYSVSGAGIVTIAATTATLADYLNVAAAASQVARAEDAFVFNGNTYVFEAGAAHLAASGTYTAGTDAVVQLVGVTGVTAVSLTASAANTVYAA